MRKNIEAFKEYQVFLNYPFDSQYSELADAMSFAVVAGGLLPVCAYDLTSSDYPRIEMLVEAIRFCKYSAHDLSRAKGAGEKNFSRMNMPIEMGMALFHAMHTQRQQHRCLFFVSTAHDYKEFASDLAGLDPKIHNDDDVCILKNTYEWLRNVVPVSFFNSQPIIEVLEKYNSYKNRKTIINGSGDEGHLSHEESRELMYQVCAECHWWDFRNNRMGQEEFPQIPLAFKS